MRGIRISVITPGVGAAKFCLREFYRIMRAPGEGLLTVSTGSGLAKDKLGTFFGKNLNQKKWASLLSKRLSESQDFPFFVLGVPSDSGGGICRGAAHGPLYLREAMYKKHKAWARYDLGDVPCIPQLVHDDMLRINSLKSCGKSLWGATYKNQPVSVLNLLTEFLTCAWEEVPHFKPLILGGDHSISAAVFEAMERHGLCEELGVLHLDAHTDLMESRFGVEHCFATWAAHSVKKLRKPSAWVQVGVRASRKPKSFWEKKYGLRQYWALELEKISATDFAHDLLKHWKNLGVKYLYISNDIDATDARWVPSTGTPENKGLNPSWVAELIEICSRSLPLVGADLVEVAPVLGSKSDAQKTLGCGLRYLESLKWI